MSKCSVDRQELLSASSVVDVELTLYARRATSFQDDDFCEARLPMLCSGCLELTTDNKLSYRRGTARSVVSVEILPIATQQCSTSPEQIEVMKLEG